MRRGELFGLQWRDLKGNQLSVQRAASVVRGKPIAGPLKSDSAYQTMGLTESTLALLKRYRVSLGVVPNRAGGGAARHEGPKDTLSD